MIKIPGKIPITIHPFFWLIAFFIGWMWTATLTGAFICLFLIGFSVLFHEYGHALTALLFGQTTRIELAAFGGFTYRTGRKLRLWEEFIIVLNGPLAGLLLSLLALAVLHYVALTTPIIIFIFRFLFVANLFWTIINLIPVMPLDGGHLLSIFFESLFGFKGIKMAIFVGLLIAALCSIFFFIIQQFLVGALFLLLAFESGRSLRYYKIFNEKDRDQALQALLKEADKEKEAGEKEKALEKYEQVRQGAKRGILYTMATQEVAALYKDKKEYRKAYDILLMVQKDLSSESLSLLHYLAFKNGDFKTTIKVGNRSYQENPNYDTALINACAHGKLGQVDAALGWLECCIRHGIPSIKEVLARPEFDSIRKTNAFKRLQSKV